MVGIFIKTYFSHPFARFYFLPKTNTPNTDCRLVSVSCNVIWSMPQWNTIYFQDLGIASAYGNGPPNETAFIAENNIHDEVAVKILVFENSC